MTSIARRPYHHGDLKRAVVQTAMAMLDEEKGWQFTLREVARRAASATRLPTSIFPTRPLCSVKSPWPALSGCAKHCEQLSGAASHPRARSSWPWDKPISGLERLILRFTGAMFGAEVGTRADTSSDERPLAAFGVMLDMLERGQQAGDWRKRNIQGQAAACWAQVHGLTMLTIDGLLQPRKLGAGAAKAALTALLEGLAT